MSRAIAMVEYKTVSAGITAADTMIKTADIDVLMAETVCPGKYIVLITGTLSAVGASVDAAKVRYGAQLIDSFVLGNPHEDIFPALYGSTEIGEVDALGIIETYSAPSMIVAADTAAKTSIVKLIEVRLCKGMCGKSYTLLTGEVAAVSAAIEAAKKSVEGTGLFLDSSVIPHPDPKLYASIL